MEKGDIDSAHVADPNELLAALSDSIKAPFDAFWNICSDDLLDIITTQTNIYANQHKGLNPPATSEEIKFVTSILLLSGYCEVPYLQLYWSTSPDTHNESVSKTISGNHFREILRFGFKFWCLCSSDGYLLHAEPYCRKDTDLPETRLEQGSDLSLV